MDLFHIQLIASFLVGGFFVAGLIYFAEKANKHLAGPILSLPSTIAVSYFFIGITVSPEAVAVAVPTTTVMLGMVSAYAVLYIYTSRIKLPTTLSVLISLLVSIIIWLLISIPIAEKQFSHMGLAIVIYVGLAAVGYYLLTLKPTIQDVVRKDPFSLSETFFRACVAGVIITLAVYLAKTLSPFWGGIFAGFPAVYTATLALLHTKHGSDFLFKTFSNTPIGGVVSFVYIFAVQYTYPLFGVLVGTLVAYPISILVLYCMYKMYNLKST